jgi:hypothetical protein
MVPRTSSESALRNIVIDEYRNIVNGQTTGEPTPAGLLASAAYCIAESMYDKSEDLHLEETDDVVGAAIDTVVCFGARANGNLPKIAQRVLRISTQRGERHEALLKITAEALRMPQYAPIQRGSAIEQHLGQEYRSDPFERSRLAEEMADEALELTGNGKFIPPESYLPISNMMDAYY